MNEKEKTNKNYLAKLVFRQYNLCSFSASARQLGPEMSNQKKLIIDYKEPC